jgi:hypothetical protein
MGTGDQARAVALLLREFLPESRYKIQEGNQTLLISKGYNLGVASAWFEYLVLVSFTNTGMTVRGTKNGCPDDSRGTETVLDLSDPRSVPVIIRTTCRRLGLDMPSFELVDEVIARLSTEEIDHSTL